MTNILELNDSRIQLWQDGELAYSSPGYALNQGGRLVFGTEAMAQARLHPRDVEHRYWTELSLDPLKTEFAGKRHFGDLAHAHLLDIAAGTGVDGDVIILVPSQFRRDQLGLLLGILRESPFRAVGLVDHSVAVAARLAAPGENTLLQLHLHHAVITQISNRDGKVVRRSVTPLPGQGLLSLKERLVSAISNAFIEQTRFDPRHKATVEQQLFDGLEDVVAALLTETETKIELEGYTARIDRDTLAASCRDSFSRLADELEQAGGSLLLDHRLAALPGTEALGSAVDTISDAVAAQVIQTASAALRQEDESLEFVTTLPAERHAEAEPSAAEPVETDATVASPAPARNAASGQASHILYRHVAYPIEGSTRIGGNEEAQVQVSAAAELVLSLRDSAMVVESLQGEVSAGGQPLVVGQQLHLGDLLLLNATGEVLQLISVAGTDGS